jgi:hypothetical protein
MSRNPSNLEREKKKIQSEELNEKKSNNTFLGVPLSNNDPDNEEQDNSFSFGFGSQNNNNNSQNFFVSPTQGTIQFGVTDPNINNNTPSIKSMIYQLELAVQSGKIDQQTIGLYQQISQLIPINSISSYSTIIDDATLEKIRQLSTISYNETKVDETQNQDDINTKNLDDNFELTAKDKENLASFYGEKRQSSADFNDSLNEIQESYQNNPSVGYPSMQPPKK